MIKPDEIVYTNRKSICVSVDSFARVRVRAPRRCKMEQIEAFLREKEGWITRKQAQMRRTGMCLPPADLDGYSFLLFGETHTLRLYDGQGIRYDKENAIVYLPSNKPKERLIAWLKENALRIFTAITQKKAAEMGVTYKSVGVSSARSRWGVCSGDNAIRYTYRLLYTPKQVIEYVVVHELSHTRYKNHGKAFWQEVAKYVPDWKSRRKWLKEHGILMQIF